MAFNKLYLVLFLLAVVTITTHATLDSSLQSESVYQCAVGPTKCASCDCTVGEDGKLSCTRTDERRGACPSTCGNPCLCDRSSCPRCLCRYKVVGCPRICPTSPNMFADFLASKTD
ncbi:hypothetical protein F8388_011228 [Cannabis sativa]|uniref:Uncharacterized protein n=1 Tax=Cannabis sativa TaxID=3483 RepID=A0A7J6FCG7_CANSA|nr:hypothetical protein F8388_011228 [Cannabis sativa]